MKKKVGQIWGHRAHCSEQVYLSIFIHVMAKFQWQGASRVKDLGLQGLWSPSVLSHPGLDKYYMMVVIPFV